MATAAEPAPALAEPAPFGVDPARGVRPSITQASVERAFAILIAVAAIGFGAINVPNVLQQLPSLDPFWGPLAGEKPTTVASLGLGDSGTTSIESSGMACSLLSSSSLSSAGNVAAGAPGGSASVSVTVSHTESELSERNRG